VNACQERRDQAERRKSRFFHKLLRLLNITDACLLQGLTETPSKLFRHFDKLFARQRRTCQNMHIHKAAMNLDSRISLESGCWIVRRQIPARQVAISNLKFTI
jgi:hypothetical protein